MARILLLTPNPIQAAATRYRLGQYLPYLAGQGLQCDLMPFLGSADFARLYQRGGTLRKLAALLLASFRRAGVLLRSRRWDAVLVSREAMLWGPPIVERALARRLPLIFDFDDAVFLSYISPTYGRMATWLKNPGKTDEIVRLSSHVLAGNDHLADYAAQRGRPVTIMPTAVDLDQFSAVPKPPPAAIPVIGWVGSHSTAAYLDIVAPALQEVARRHRFLFRVVGAGRPLDIPGVEVQNVAWSLEREIPDFRQADVGVYPIHDDPWGRGKCAFKSIQFMAAKVPCICSPVGMTRQVVAHGENGLLAETTSEWVAGLETLLTDASLRARITENGWNTVNERYSTRVHAPRLAAVLDGICAR